MIITKYKNNMDSYDFELKDNNKVLRISFGGTLDLYMSISNGEIIGLENTEISFDITKEDYEIFSIFDKLYSDIIDGNIYDNKSSKTKDIDYTLINQYKNLVDKKNNINWISDEGPEELEDRLRIIHKDDDTYTITFFRSDKPMDFGFKSSSSITVRFRNSGSRYAPFNCVFMRMYQALQDVDPSYHQIHIEEYQYKKRKNKNLQ